MSSNAAWRRFGLGRIAGARVRRCLDRVVHVAVARNSQWPGSGECRGMASSEEVMIDAKG